MFVKGALGHQAHVNIIDKLEFNFASYAIQKRYEIVHVRPRCMIFFVV